MEALRYISNVVSLKMEREKCTGCGICHSVCPHGVFEIEDKKAKVADRDACMECGACALNCPAEAIRVSPGVGCAAYIIQRWIRGKENASCSSGTCC